MRTAQELGVRALDRDWRRAQVTHCSFLQVTTSNSFWAKTTSGGLPGISVHDHCLNVGCVTEAMIELLPDSVKTLLPVGAATLAALHDVGKITWISIQVSHLEYPPGSTLLSSG